MVCCTASNTILAVESDASFLSVAEGRSRAAGYFFLTNKPAALNGPYTPNSAVHVLCHIMREVLSSAAEAELGALFHNGKEACPIGIVLKEMGHPQPAKPMASDNNTASGIATDTVKQKRSKAIDIYRCRTYPACDLRESYREGHVSLFDEYNHHPKRVFRACKESSFKSCETTRLYSTESFG